jgi:hypothetical protein
MARSFLAVAVALGVLALVPSVASAATCSDYSNQAAAQRAADTRDGDGDGVYCESLPCPCLKPGGTPPPPPPAAPPPPPAAPEASCSRPRGVQPITFSRAKYPNIRRHMERAIARGWPRVMVVNRPGADARRDRLMASSIPTKPGFDRDEYPAAVGRGRPNGNKIGLVRGANPRGWLADVMYVRSSENRSHGATLGARLRPFCNGTQFRYVFR